MKKLIAAMALSAGLAMPASAAINIIPNEPVTTVAWNNNYEDEINAWAGGLADFYGGAGLFSTSAGTLHFYFMAAESGWSDTFTADGGAVTYKETESYSAWGPAQWIGSMGIGAGAITDLHFSAPKGTFSGGNTADVGVDGEFAIISKGGTWAHDELLFAFDDTCCDNGVDDNHDDIIILAKFISAVPEPATWLMMIMGFGLVGLAARRRSAIATA
ncbi:PEPxxWA-CTERM sorting domain-containing protein [Pseudokordiimonas caeni]|uniref:PEPxxWA-CTERM sorting domain-containing protein n=1 Tax=Pseudokordiimonas caeni TaxID=2997908 RepID=UPI0028117B14|nr:PEPxxWA-CTERM sorting domain-containing protein [Pseudokordiimonas caeni]